MEDDIFFNVLFLIDEIPSFSIPPTDFPNHAANEQNS